jgi:hypothetical protein
MRLHDKFSSWSRELIRSFHILILANLPQPVPYNKAIPHDEQRLQERISIHGARSHIERRG